MTLQVALVVGWIGPVRAQVAGPSIPPPTTSPGPFPKAVDDAKRPAATPDPNLAGPARSATINTAGERQPTVATPARGASDAAPRQAGTRPTTEITTEERLRRMEDAYLRMEQNNQRIQAQYSNLLQRYDDLSRKLSEAKATTGNSTPLARPAIMTASSPLNASRSPGNPGRQLADLLGFEDAEEPRVAVGLSPLFPEPDPPQQAGGAEGTGGRTGIDQQPTGLPGVGGSGSIGRGGLSEAPELEPFRSRMDRIGAGAEGTGGRTYPGQQPAAVSGARARGEVGAYKPEAGGEEGATRAPGSTDLKPKRHPGKIAFGEGLEFTSDDGEFKLQFHNLTQAEYRGFDPHDTGVLSDQFFVPRQRWYFVGDLTRNVGFYTVINRGYGSLDLLDAFVTLRYSNALRLRIGRMKTPYLYEYFSIAEGDLIAPERSIYAGNFALNRQIGFMFLGELFKDQLSYAAGLYNGPRRSFQDLNSAKDIVGNITWRPFLLSERFKALNYFNIGGSWSVGYQNNNPPQPVYFETANDQTPNNATSLSPTFLHLNNNVIELGERVQWGAHAVWYYKSFFALAEYGGSRAGYGFVNNTTSVPIDFSGYNVTLSYFVTGEQVTRRVNMVQPIRDFNFNFLKPGEKFSPGAVELFARYCTMDMGRNIFTGGFADPNLWTNHVWATDIGLNWYLNFYTRIYLDWQHAGYGNEVNVAPGKFSSTSDIYWLRFQVFF